MTKILISGVVRRVQMRAWGSYTAMALAWLLACPAAFAQLPQDGSTAPDPAAQTSVKLAGVYLSLPAGAPWLSLGVGTLFCISTPNVQTWAGGRVSQELSPYYTPFKTELERAGYKVITPGEDNLFDREAGSADYEVAAVISDAHIEGCVMNGAYFTDKGSVRGSGSMKIDWQLYSRLRKEVVARVSTAGVARLDKSVPGGVVRLITESFASNAHELAANADFRAAVSAPKAFSAGFQMPGQQSGIALAGSLKARSRKIADAVGSVVLIATGLGTGSGVLVSDDGYILTNAHVVGDDKNVRVRWSDGFETLAKVERVSKNRDVAIIKTDARDRTPLTLKRGPVTPGQRVYAIGSPKGKAFEGTVSSGVVSADRVFDGLRYIQSDTVVSHGSSGGPLLDESGAVIGLTDLGVPNDGPAGLNLFIPIGDAMDFLSLEQH
jgi:serine protease Do